MIDKTIGFAFCGSFCTYESAMESLFTLSSTYQRVIPIFSQNSAALDSRFGRAEEHLRRAQQITGSKAICTIPEAEPIGPKKLLDLLVIAPCTGNTLAKLAHGIADTTVTMAAKSHLRNGRPIVVAVSTNDGLGAAAENIGRLLPRKHFYFVPFGQDNPIGKPRSLVADFGQLPETIDAAFKGEQIQPILL